jgi:hypothetical protein
VQIPDAEQTQQAPTQHTQARAKQNVILSTTEENYFSCARSTKKISILFPRLPGNNTGPDGYWPKTQDFDFGWERETRI